MILKVEGTHNLRPILVAHVHAQHLRAIRLVVLHLLAVAGGMCWALMSWPEALPYRWRLVALLGWPVGLVLLILFGIIELKWNTRLFRLAQDEEPPPDRPKGGGIDSWDG